MKTLFLVRHAKSSWDNALLSDHDRPLNDRGKRDAPRMGKRLAARSVKPDVLISSPALRAYSTAIRIAKEINYPEDRIKINESLYHGGATEALDVISDLSTDAATAMLFGHNPTMTLLVSHLTRGNIANVPTCGIAEIQFEVESWANVAEGSGKMILFDYPKRIAD